MRTLIRYYAKRWGIETSFRDIKDWRFGMGMSVMRIRRVKRRHRMLLLSATVSIPLLTLLRAASECLGGYDRWLKRNIVRTRMHSLLFRQGLTLYEHIPNWSEHRLRPFVDKFAQVLMEQRVCREIKECLSHETCLLYVLWVSIQLQLSRPLQSHAVAFTRLSLRFYSEGHRSNEGHRNPPVVPFLLLSLSTLSA